MDFFNNFDIGINMGMFSWQTADTGKSIYNIYSDRPHSDKGSIYLLQPDGEPSIEEVGYEGYGVFGDVDAYIWLTLHNISDDEFNDICIKLTGDKINIDHVKQHFLTPNESISQDNDDQLNALREKLREYSIYKYGKNKLFDPITDEQIIQGFNDIPYHYNTPIERYDGKSLNQLISEDFFNIKDSIPAYPLKFSFDKNAHYESLSASEGCPNQGVFLDYDESEDYDDEQETDYDNGLR